MNDEQRKKIIEEAFAKRKEECERIKVRSFPSVSDDELIVYPFALPSIPRYTLIDPSEVLGYSFKSVYDDIEIAPQVSIHDSIERYADVSFAVETSIIERTFVCCDETSWYLWSAKTPLHPDPYKVKYLDPYTFAHRIFGIDGSKSKFPLSFMLLSENDLYYRAILIWSNDDDKTIFEQHVTFSNLSQDFWKFVAYYELDPSRIREFQFELVSVSPKEPLNSKENLLRMAIDEAYKRKSELADD